jgi:sugar O-acyltransferase (sialic acid O-acetyltransferase NeuD family)
MEEIILVGGGGHCKACIDVIELEGKFRIAGIVDVKEKIGQSVLGYRIIASDENLADLAKEYKNFLITIGHIKSPTKRVGLYRTLKKLNVKFPVIVSPLAYVSKHSFIGEGTIIMHGAIVNSGVKTGVNCIINSKALLEHDVKVGNHCHISTGAIINGNSQIGSFSFVGSGSVISNGITITDNVIIGAGAVIVTDINESGIYVGNPGRRIK